MPIREAQRQFVIQDGNALLVTATGRTKGGDRVHLTTAEHHELGCEIARALLCSTKKTEGVDWPGPILDAATLGADGKTVVAHFAEVKNLAGVAAADFGIVDVGGQSRTVRARAIRAVAGNTIVTLSFDEPVQLPAALVYGTENSPKAELTDEAGNRAPAVQMEIKRGSPPQDRASAAPNGAGP